MDTTFYVIVLILATIIILLLYALWEDYRDKDKKE